jgi:predicted transcriptional regulator YheO
MDNSTHKSLYSVINDIDDAIIDYDIELLATIFETDYVTLAFFDAQKEIFRTQSKLQTPIEEIKFIINKFQSTNSLIKNYFSSTGSDFKFPTTYDNLTAYIGNTIKNKNQEIIGILYVLCDYNNISDIKINTLQLMTDRISKYIQHSIVKHKDFRKIVHDIKNPLTSISLQAELICKLSASNDQTKLLAEKISESIKKLNIFLNNH